MDIALSAATSGMAAAARRLGASAANVANARTTGPLPADGDLTSPRATPASGAPYAPVRAVDAAAPEPAGVRSRIVPAAPAWRAEHQPDSPDANANGLVAAPAVDPATEAVEQIRARAAYAANATVARSAADMQRAVLDLKA